MPTAHDLGEQVLDLRIGGMTCASCAARVERQLNEVDGVHATVNLATERAHVVAPAGVDAASLVREVQAVGYTATVRHDDAPAHDHGGRDDIRSLRRRVLLTAVLAVPVIAMAMIRPLQFDGWQWLSLALATPVVTWATLPLHRATLANLRHGAASMDTLISVGIVAAFGWSLYALLLGGAGEIGMEHGFSLTADPTAGGEQIYLEVAAGVTLFILVGRYLEARAGQRSSAALRALLELGAKDVAVLRDGQEERIGIDELAVGDRFVVRPGEKVATDGVIESGSSAIDASLLTGESVPVDVGPGDTVTGATINTGGRLVVRAARVGRDTALAQIGRLIEAAQSGKAPVQRLADRVSAVFVPIVIVLAAATLGFWLTAADVDGTTVGFTAAVAVLIIACPCALGLATPTALMVGTGRGAQLGVVIRGPEILESTRAIDTILLDKTGTVTTGEMALLEVVAADGGAPDEVLRLAAAVEQPSEHPIARAIVEAARERGQPIAPASEFSSTPGSGVTGLIDGRRAWAGRSDGHASALPDALVAAVRAAEGSGHTAIVVGWDEAPRGVLVIGDTVRSSSHRAVSELRALGLRPVLLTGDNERAARAVAAGVGIDEVIADVRPEGKVEAVTRLQEQGAVVAMVGDGVNDAAALARADLGLAMATGTDVAIQASDITLVRGDLMAVVDAVRLSRRTLRTIKANLAWAFAYNLAAIPVAAAALLNPMLAGAAMAASSLFVVTNSLRLKRFPPSAA